MNMYLVHVTTSTDDPELLIIPCTTLQRTDGTNALVDSYHCSSYSGRPHGTASAGLNLEKTGSVKLFVTAVSTL